MLTREAFNALLKTLEEPPSHIIFILATTEYEKLPPTIISRTQKFHFKKLPVLKIIEKLSAIAGAEKVEIEPAALEVIAAAGEGSLRDSESLFDQLASFSKNINLELVEKNLGRIGSSKLIGFADGLLQGDLKTSLSRLSDIHENGYNLTQFAKELIHYLRRVMALKFDPELETMLKNELTSEELGALKRQSKIIDEKKHIPLLKSLIRAYSEMRYSPFAIVPLEVAIIENLTLE